MKTLDISLPDKKKILDKNTDAAKKIEDDCRAKGIRILTVEDTSYPSLLLQTVSPPLVLYYKGTVPDWNRRPCFAVVGTRAMSDYGAASAADICFDLGRMDCITVSGMALGIDGMAAAATLEAGGTTVAVLGSGLDVIYPAAHTFLYETILKNGGIVLSEYPPGSRPERYHFPVRNRIISGIARGIIMVEGNANSGALITAEIGLREGRAVFAVPGKIGEKNQEGALLLLKSGASAITCADDIYDRFKDEYVGKLNGFSLLTPRKIFFKSIMAKYRITGGYAKHESALGESGYIREPAFRKTLSVASAKPSIWEKTIKMAKELVKKDEKATLEEATVPPCGMNDKEKLV
ncbi:MAG: DNA-processing protein DprA, partial [Clostridia bacterium]|nr:DNA-processing protein DprA [Clostridia bacterium]